MEKSGGETVPWTVLETAWVQVLVTPLAVVGFIAGKMM
jgi:hypothetical protein